MLNHLSSLALYDAAALDYPDGQRAAAAKIPMRGCEPMCSCSEARNGGLV